MSAPCGTCGGDGLIGELGIPVSCAACHSICGCDRAPCPECRRVVSVGDAEVAAAVREVEAHPLPTGPEWNPMWVDYEPYGPLGRGPRWRVQRGNGEADAIVGEGDTLPAALAAYKRAAARVAATLSRGKQ